MTLGSDIESALPKLREEAESMMRTQVTIRRAGPEVRNPATGKLEQSWLDIYVGKCRLKFTAGQPREGDQAGQRFSDQSPTLSLPMAGTGSIRVDDVATIDHNPFDPEGESLRLRVTGLHVQTHSTARRLPVEVLNFS